MILIIDNYDSFTYNVAQLFQSRGEEVLVRLNDQISIEEIRDLNPEGIILSPGPCTPQESGVCLEVVEKLQNQYPILGICLGHQVIGEVLGAKVVRANNIYHGKLDHIRHMGQGILEGINSGFQATRYHSLVIERGSVPSVLEVMATAISDDEIMAVQHVERPIFGLQFHPESYGTSYGEQIADNFIKIMKEERSGGTCR
ncbi:MAG: aminodeoxychorismate/anthranilate synthase component II [Clostridia bacterium]|nr:aminodeoxychorismate/anthranilate synthase component II [Clostridia bacterium]